VTSDIERLRRELRAMATVNHQLLAMQDEPIAARKVRRAGAATGWIEELATRGVCPSAFVRADDGSVYVVEGGTKRPVRSGILAAALEPMLKDGPGVTPEALADLDEGCPVELLEATTGPPFVVLGGRRHTVTGIPLPMPVDDLQASDFPEGVPINAAAANVSRARFDAAMSGSLHVGRARNALASKGVTGSVKAAGRRLRAVLASSTRRP
jgi:hypothetical protein